MILNEKNGDVAVCGDFQTTNFKLQANAKAFEILSSNIYTDKVSAVIRELSCNAHDAHADAGNPEPFHVHLPTYLEPWFSVVDNGNGLSDSEIREIFTTYFLSTKTNSDKFIGALGLGSKSPFSIRDSFTVISRHGGFIREYSCYRDENGEPQIALLTEKENTDKSTGIEVKVNADNMVSEFRTKAITVFTYFDSLPEFNDKELKEDIERERADFKFVSDNFGFRNTYGDLVAVMGNVAYNIPHEYNKHSISGYIRFDISNPYEKLSFDPGRENLSLDEKTKTNLKNKIDQVFDSLSDIMLDQVSQEPTSFKRAKMFASFTGVLGSLVKDKKFDSYKLPNLKESEIQVFSKPYSYRTMTVGKVGYINFGKNVIYCLHRPRMTSRIREYLKNNPGTLYLLTQDQIDELKIDPEFIIDANDLPKVVRSSNGSSASSRSKVAVWNGGTGYYGRNASSCWDDTSVDTADGEERVYVQIHRYEIQDQPYYLDSPYSIENTFKEISQWVPQVEVFGLKPAFINSKKFDKGNWISLHAYIKRELQSNAPEKVYTYSGNTRISNVLYKIADVCTDADIQEFLRIDKIRKSSDAKIFKNAGCSIDEDDSLDKLMEKIEERYPVLRMLKNRNSWSETTDDEIEIIKHYVKGD